MSPSMDLASLGFSYFRDCLLSDFEAWQDTRKMVGAHGARLLRKALRNGGLREAGTTLLGFGQGEASNPLECCIRAPGAFGLLVMKVLANSCISASIFLHSFPVNSC